MWCLTMKSSNFHQVRQLHKFTCKPCWFVDKLPSGQIKCFFSNLHTALSAAHSHSTVSKFRKKCFWEKPQCWLKNLFFNFFEHTRGFGVKNRFQRWFQKHFEWIEQTLNFQPFVHSSTNCLKFQPKCETLFWKLKNDTILKILSCT